MDHRGFLARLDERSSYACSSTTASRQRRTIASKKVLPVVTPHAFRFQEAYNTLLDVLDGAEIGGDDEAVDEHEFILAELLRIALNLDYADEIGRRRLEQFVRMYCLYSFRGEFVKTMFGRTYDIAGSSTFRARHTVPRRSTHSIFKRARSYTGHRRSCA